MSKFEKSPAWRRAAYAAAGIALAVALIWVVERLLLLGVVRHLVALAVAVPFGMLLYGMLEEVVEDALEDRRERREECSTRHTT